MYKIFHHSVFSARHHVLSASTAPGRRNSFNHPGCRWQRAGILSRHCRHRRRQNPSLAGRCAEITDDPGYESQMDFNAVFQLTKNKVLKILLISLSPVR